LEVHRPFRIQLFDFICRMDLKFAPDHGLKAVTPEYVEAERSQFATSWLINRWFSAMLPGIQGGHPSVILNSDETMLQVGGRGRIILKNDGKAFKRKVGKSPHFAWGACISPLRTGPPPWIIAPACKGFVQDFVWYQSRGWFLIESSPSG
jgi:hypothetical protein